MSAMPAVELPEAPAALLDEPADLLAIVAAVQPARSTTQPTRSTAQPTRSTAQPGQSAARRAAARWTQPLPAAASVAPETTASPAAHPVPSRDPAASAPSRSHAAGAPLRLTRRGRIVIGIATVVLLAALSLIVAVSAQATSQAPAGSGRGVTQVTVQPGQSLWSVAESADPSADTRAVVQQIVELNSLTGSAVFAGQRLWVPRG